MGQKDSHESCEIASFKGHLEVLKYLHENGCPWNKYCEIASRERTFRSIEI